MQDSTTVEGGNNALDRSFERGNNVCNKFVLALDCTKRIKILRTYIDTFLCISTLEGRLVTMFLCKFLNQFGRSIGCLAKHDARSSLQARNQCRIFTFKFLQCFLKQGVLHYLKFYLLFEAFTTKSTCRRTVKSSNIYKIEVGILLNFLNKFFY